MTEITISNNVSLFPNHLTHPTVKVDPSPALFAQISNHPSTNPAACRRLPAAPDVIRMLHGHEQARHIRNDCCRTRRVDDRRVEIPRPIRTTHACIGRNSPANNISADDRTRSSLLRPSPSTSTSSAPKTPSSPQHSPWACPSIKPTPPTSFSTIQSISIPSATFGSPDPTPNPPRNHCINPKTPPST